MIKVFFEYFPKGAWFTLLVATLLKFYTEESEALLNMVIIFISLYFFLKITTLLHESGHMLAAWLVGGVPRRMIVGTGPEIHRTEWRGVKIVLKALPVSGMALAHFNESPQLRKKFGFFVIGGVLLNLIAGLLCLLIFGYHAEFFTGDAGIDLASAFIFANGLCLINVIPFYSTFYGSRLPSDGLGFFQVMFGSYKEVFQSVKYNDDYFQAYEYFENREYDKALELYQKLNEKIPDELGALTMMAVIMIKQCKPDEAIDLLKTLNDLFDANKMADQKGLHLNNLAWAYLLKNDLDEAHRYATLAIEALPENRNIGCTYGSILIERGDVEIGMRWVRKNIDFDHPSDETLCASMYRMLGAHLNGDDEMRDEHKRYVTAYQHALEKDSLFLWERCLQRVSR
ncbi:hypothetical protein WSM22_16490 [Cytophagales bacterium WSM2-2]|nr:hypothetical protein WSM22_16490 [Cytophagales bacterium WSM2-2]